jgi:hypothetical protein
MNITTTYKTNDNGRSQIVAKANGKQRTVSFDPSKSSDWNHGNAAGVLILALDAKNEFPFNRRADGLVRSIDHNEVTHTANDGGTVHRFVL